MGQSTLADFPGTFEAETADWDGHVEGRAVLGEGQLVLAAGRNDTVTIPLSSVFDVTFDTRPELFDPLPGTPVSGRETPGIRNQRRTESPIRIRGRAPRAQTQRAIYLCPGQRGDMEETRLTRRRLLAAAGTSASAAIAGCLLEAPGSTSADQPQEFPTEFDPPSRNDEQPVAEAEFTEVYRDLVDSVGAVRVEPGDQPDSGGTAWVFQDDYLVTNEHVVRTSDDPYVWFNETGWRQATVVGRDVYSDLAVIEARDKPDSAAGMTLVDQPRAVGTRVAAIGNPFNLTSSFTTGVISGRNRTIDIPGTQFSIADGVQTDAALNPGNSGGPLVTLDGDVVGVINAGRGDNVGFAISAAMVDNVVPSLISEGEYDHSYMGVGLRPVSPRLIEANDLPVSWGVYIVSVRPGSPSDGVLRGASGDTVLRGVDVPTGGDVIVRMEDWAIPDNERLSAFLALETDPGDTIEVEVIRDGEREVVDLTLGSRPDPTM